MVNTHDNPHADGDKCDDAQQGKDFRFLFVPLWIQLAMVVLQFLVGHNVALVDGDVLARRHYL
jgi:hypothetical protein